MSTCSRERGVALGLALITIVIGAGLSALLFFVAFEEHKLSDSGRQFNESLGAAEGGALEALRVWDPRVYNVHDPYPFDSASLPAHSPGAWAYSSRRYKLNGELYLLLATSEAGVAWHQVGLLAHLRSIEPNLGAALKVGRGARRTGSVFIEGRDDVPPAWDPCGPSDTDRGGLVVDSAARAGGLSYSDLVSHATWSLPGRSYVGNVHPTAVDGHCDEAVTTNWGDGRAPSEVCGGYLPVVHIVGDAALGDGQGQGSLLVDGDLRIAGRFEWRGLVFVRGTLHVSAPTGEVAIWGGVVVGDSAILEAGVAGSVAITYSKCAIVKALESVTSAVMLPSRGWIGFAEEP